MFSSGEEHYRNLVAFSDVAPPNINIHEKYKGGDK